MSSHTRGFAWLVVALWVAALGSGRAQAPMGGTAPATGDSATKRYDDLIKDATRLDGMFTLYRQKERLLLELAPDQLGQPFLVVATLESGLGERGILSGMPLNYFEASVYLFRRVNDTLHLVQRNPRFRSSDNGPVQRAVQRSFSDAVVAALRIEAEHPDRKTLLVSLNGVLLSDLPELSAMLSGLGAAYTLSADRSYFGTVKAFPQNVEIESVLQFSASRSASVESLVDGRHLTLRVRYSLSQMPPPGFKPRLADPRIGYFLTVHKEFSDDRRPQAFVRYINRWRLEPSDPTAPLSPPRKPIIFWLENAIPVAYREPIRQGVLLWNKAFERIGIRNAIEVRQMPDDADWDPADVRYNVIRWITSNTPSFGAMGPSRVDPFTGEILDADIVFEGENIRGMRSYYRRYLGLPEELSEAPPPPATRPPFATCSFGLERSEQAPLVHLTRHLLLGPTADTEKAIDEVVRASLVEIAAHEVGHTLGLRHNFAASNFLRPNELHNPEITRRMGICASVMEYNPPNLAPPGVRQGELFSSTLGPYDYWAIEYGYRVLPGKTPEEDLPELRKIAARSAERGHAYATDEDMTDDLDPRAARFDLSSDPLEWARGQLDLIRTLLPRVEKLLTRPNVTYADLRRVFDTLLTEYRNKAEPITRHVTGQYVSKSFPGDPGGRRPYHLVPLAKKRAALAALERYYLGRDVFRFQPEVLNSLGVERYSHWGVPPSAFGRLDYPIHDRIAQIYQTVLGQLTSPRALARLRDDERRAPRGTPILTQADLFAWLSRVCWSELDSTTGRIAIDSFRRVLQREHLTRLVTFVVQPPAELPADSRALAAFELRRLRSRIAAALRRAGAMDTMTRAHLEDANARIAKALAAQYQSAP